MSDSSRGSGVNIVEVGVLVLLAIIAGVIVLAILAPRLANPPRPRRQLQTTAQIRGIHQSMAMYAQNNGGYYPGLDHGGNVVDATVEGRFHALVSSNLFPGEYMLSPMEAGVVWTTGEVTPRNYSYAMLDIDAPGKRVQEWADAQNPDAVMLSDRNTGSDATANVASIWTEESGTWEGGTVRNDNSTEHVQSHLLDTRYGPATDEQGQPVPLNEDDNLFHTASGDDAYMIHSGR